MTRQPDTPVGVTIDHLRYHYPDGSPALADISLAIAPGERVALLGPNGAGKSTLLMHMAGLLPERGRYVHTHAPSTSAHQHGATPASRITIGDITLGPATLARIRDLVGIVFQDPDDQLIGLTVAEDVAYGPRARRWPPDAVARAVHEALDRVGLRSHEHRSPHHLSTGEKRRVCLAGVLVCRPGLLLMDEPSSGLDPRGRRELAALLAGLAATQVLATQDLALVAHHCTRAVILDEGRLVADGPAPQVLADPALLLRHGLA